MRVTKYLGVFLQRQINRIELISYYLTYSLTLSADVNLEHVRQRVKSTNRLIRRS